MLSALSFRNEWRLLARHPLVWIAIAATLAFCALASVNSRDLPDDAVMGELRRLNLLFPIFVLPFLAGALGPVFLLREVDHGMEEMVGALPITVRAWLGARLGNFLLVLLATSIAAQTMFLARLIAGHGSALPDLLLQSARLLLTVHAPACLIWAGLLAWLSCRTGSTATVYVAAGAGWLGYLGLALLTGSPLIAGSIVAWPPLLQALLVLDPYAATGLVNPMPETGALQWRWLDILAGRLLWLLIVILLIRSIRKRPSSGEGASFLPMPRLPQFIRSDPDRRSLPAPRELVRLQLQFIARDRIFPLLIGGWFLLLLPEMLAGMDYAEPLSSVVPDSRDALHRIAFTIVPGAATLLLLYAADRLCRMYAITGMQELVATTPMRSHRFVAAQLASLLLVLLFFLLLAGLAALMAQLIAGSPVQPGEYLSQLTLLFSRLAPFAILFTALHGLVRQRLFANLANALVMVLSLTTALPALGLEHPLARPLFSPLTMPDHVWGFAGSLTGHWRFTLFWGPICLAALLLAMLGYHRLMPLAQARWRSMVARPVAAALPLLLGLAGWQGMAIHRDLAAEGALVASGDRSRWQADYERGYAGWSNIPQPEIAAVRSRVDFYPDESRVRLRATMQLVNRMDMPIRRILVGRNQLPGVQDLALEGASVERRDDALGQTVFALQRPMLPRETRALTFRMEFAHSGLRPASAPLVLRQAFSAVPGYLLYPVIGFQREYTLRTAATRQAAGLSPLQVALPSQLGRNTVHRVAPAQAMLETIVGTHRGHVGIAQGDLVGTWQDRGREYFHFRSNGAIRNLPTFFSMPQGSQEWQAGGITLQLYAPKPLATDHPTVLGMRDTVEWLGRDVARFPGSTLRMLAVPEIGLSGYARPQIIEISHRLGFRARPAAGAGFSQAYRRSVHETAHQWFGHLLGYGVTEEYAFLAESLAKFAELVMIERRYGNRAVDALVAYERGRYRRTLRGSEQPITPLVDADDAEDMYSRSTLVFACLRTLTGDKAMVRALADLSRKVERGSAATSLDFVAALQAASPPRSRRAITVLLLGTQPLSEALERQGCRTGSSFDEV